MADTHFWTCGYDLAELQSLGCLWVSQGRMFWGDIVGFMVGMDLFIPQLADGKLSLL